jgi:hypothetical protein
MVQQDVKEKLDASMFLSSSFFDNLQKSYYSTLVEQDTKKKSEETGKAKNLHEQYHTILQQDHC